ncbi:hypothetical protein [Herbiconiux sp. L3-i23]|uniref:hypothetical protein n=1 Tax=Herbiconiux sp. L3-i23 TaxID=2905871 RepID=UPI002074A0D3|nr:hypothetical protein [Herbiconiux sp. L3-i23]
MDVRGEVNVPGSGGGAGGAGGGAELPFVYENAASCDSGAGQITGVICRNDISVTFAGTDIPWRPLTIADIASFTPQQPQFRGQPSGWALRGLHANFVGSATAHVVAGQLLGAPAEVRFTPIAWHWEYGDGTSRVTSTGGATWAELGVERFAPTPTSHVYRQRGEVDVSVGVEYAAEYRFQGSGWGTVQGTLIVAAPSTPLIVTTASTVLVDGECRSQTMVGC